VPHVLPIVSYKNIDLGSCEALYSIIFCVISMFMRPVFFACETVATAGETLRERSEACASGSSPSLHSRCFLQANPNKPTKKSIGRILGFRFGGFKEFCFKV